MRVHLILKLTLSHDPPRVSAVSIHDELVLRQLLNEQQDPRTCFVQGPSMEGERFTEARDRLVEMLRKSPEWHWALMWLATRDGVLATELVAE